MTTTLHELRQNLSETREQYGRRSSRTAEAFQALVRAAAEAGTPLDGLRHHTENEVERFFSWTIPGVDGHVYWDGAKSFFQNNGTKRTPVRWWFHHKYENLPDSYGDLVNKCGERHCINPEHFAKERARGMLRHWTHERIIGAMQVAAMRLGHTPTSKEWTALGLTPSEETIRARFDNWERATEAAGLPPAEWSSKPRGKTDVLRGIQLVRKILGKWPTQQEYKTCGAELKAAGLPVTMGSARRHYGTFAAARVAAGGHTSRQQERTAVSSPVDSTSRESGASPREDQ